MTPRFRFTITEENLAPAGIVVRQPIGWREAKLVLERDPNYNSLVEYFESEFIWYGSAYRLLKQIRQQVGVDAKVQVLIELTYRKESWQTIFNGLIPLHMGEEFTKGVIRYKIKIPIIRDDFWAKFINNSKQPVDLLGTTDLDGNARTPISKTVLPLPSQVIREKIESTTKNQFLQLRNVDFLSISDIDPLTYLETSYSSLVVDDIIQLNIADILNLDEIKDRFSIPLTKVDERANPILRAKYSGNYRFDIRIESSIYSSCAANNGLGANSTREYDIKDVFFGSELYVEMYFQVNDEPPIKFDMESSPLVLSKTSTYYTLNETLDLLEGDDIRIFAKVIQDLDNLDADVGAHPFLPDGTELPPLGLGTTTVYDNINYLFFWGSDNDNLYLDHYNYAVKVQQDAFNFYWLFGSDLELDKLNAGSAPSGEVTPTYMNIEADTIYGDTQADTFLLKDAAESILSKITGNDSVVTSNALDGIRGKVAITLGKHIRGYEYSEKPISMNWEDFWKGAKPLAALGLGYVEGQNKIEIEAIESFFVPINSVVLSKIKNFTQEDDEEKLVKLIRYGFEEWSAESASGIDDPQTTKWRRTRFTLIGSEIEIVSSFFTASLGIEQARRNKIEKGKDYRLDENIIAVAVKEDGVGGYTPEVGTDFDTIEELLNSDTRWNVRFFTSRIFKRWQSWLQGVFIGYENEFFYYSKGEGNEKASVKFQAGDSEAQIEDTDGLAENDNIATGVTGVMSSEVYKISDAPMRFEQYKRIRENRKNSIGIELPEGTLPMFIKKLEFQIVRGKFSAELWKALTGARIFDDSFGPEFN